MLQCCCDPEARLHMLGVAPTLWRREVMQANTFPSMISPTALAYVVYIRNSFHYLLQVVGWTNAVSCDVQCVDLAFTHFPSRRKKRGACSRSDVMTLPLLVFQRTSEAQSKHSDGPCAFIQGTVTSAMLSRCLCKECMLYWRAALMRQKWTISSLNDSLMQT